MGESENREENKKGAWWQPAVFMFLRLSAWIATPVLLAVFIGKWLDEKFGTEPWLFLGLVGTSFLASMFILTREVTKEYEKLEKKDDNKKHDNKD